MSAGRRRRHRRGGAEEVGPTPTFGLNVPPAPLPQDVGGRHRRSTRKSKKSKKSKKGGKTRRHRKVRGGGYGFQGALDGSTNGAEWGSSNTSVPYSSSTGAAIPDPFGTAGQSGSSRRRRSRRVKRRTMKGGSGMFNVSGVGYGFSNPVGGVHGIAPATGYPARVGGAPDGAIAGVKAA